MIDISKVMPIERIDDWEDRIKRHDATFNMEVLDRPFVDISYFDYNPDYPFPTKTHGSFQDRWLDGEYQADLFKAIIMSELKPEGVWMHVKASNEEEAQLILKKIRKWK